MFLSKKLVKAARQPSEKGLTGKGSLWQSRKCQSVAIQKIKDPTNVK